MNSDMGQAAPATLSFQEALVVGPHNTKPLSPLVLYFDGASRGNGSEDLMGEASAGAVLFRMTGGSLKVVDKLSICLGRASNNVAEARAANLGMDMVCNYGTVSGN